MTRPVRLLGILSLAGVLAVLTASAGAQDTPGREDTFKDRDAFLPKRKFQQLPGKAMGILVGDGHDLMTSEGRRGPKDALCFSSGDGSYRWVYVVVKKKPQIGALNVPVLGKPGEIERFDNLSMATVDNVAHFGVKKPNCLVEVEVNGGLGSPPGEHFVATDIRVVENSKEIPFEIDEFIGQVRRKYESFVASKAKDIDKAMQEAQEKFLKNAKLTGPREKQDLAFVSWLPESQRLLIRLKTQVSDGAYKTARVKDVHQVPGDPKPRVGEKEVRYGKSFGVELGMTYEISKKGRLERSQLLPLKAFEKELPPPPKATLVPESK